MRDSRSLCIYITHRSRNIGSDGCADVLSKNHCSRQFEGYDSGSYQDHDDCHCGNRTLEADGQYDADDKEDGDAAYSKVCPRLKEGQVFRGDKIAGCSPERCKADEEKGEADDYFSQILTLLALFALLVLLLL